MSDLSDGARSLIERAKQVEEPTSEDRARVQSLLAARLGAGAFAPEQPDTGAPPSSATGLGMASKIIIGVSIVGVIAGGALLSRRAPESPQMLSAVLRTVLPTARPVEEPPIVPESLPVQQAPAASAPRERAPRTAASAPSVADEVQILTRAYSSLKGGDANQALNELDQHARRFPNGALAEERAAERVLALCQLGRLDEARADAAKFFARYPNSPQGGRVRGSCGGSSETP